MNDKKGNPAEGIDLGTYELDEHGKVVRYPGRNIDAPAEAEGRVGEVRRPLRCDGMLTAGDCQTLRKLVTDRIEDRFRAAVKAATEMSVKNLLNVTEEIKTLDALWDRLKALREKLEDRT